MSSFSTDRRIGTVARITAFTALAALVLVLARVAQLQLAPGRQLEALVSERVTTTPEHAARGDLIDARGRVLAATRFGYRVFVDPTEFPSPPGDAIATLALALGMRPDEVAARVIPKMVENQRRAALNTDDDPANDRKPIRYVSVGRVLEDEKVPIVRNLRIPGVELERRSVREMPGEPLVAGLLGRVGIDHNGLMGAELALDKSLTGVAGRLSFVRDARGRPLWVWPGSYRAPQRGQDARLSIDLEVQRIVVEELTRGVEECDAAGGRCVVLDPWTGEVLAMADVLRPVKTEEYPWTYPIGQEPGGRRPRYTTIRAGAGSDAVIPRNRCVEDAYEPGSTFKPFMWAEVTALGLARPDEVFNTYHGEWTTPYGRRIADVEAFGTQTWAHILVYSSNIGMVQGTARMTFKQMRDAVRKLGFGSRTNIGLPGESAGLVTPLKRWSNYSQTSVASGYEVAVTPLQMVRAFSVFARTGELAGTLPPIRLTAGDGEGAAVAGERVFPADIANLTRITMKGVTERLDSRLSRRAQTEPLRYDAFGKSGTAEIPLGPPPPGKRRPKGSDGYFQGQYNSSFLAAAPVDKPRIVVVVVIDDPGPQRVATGTHYGAATAGPVNRRIIERTLSYLGVPPTVPLTGGTESVALTDR